MNQPATQWPNPTRQSYVRKFAFVYCVVTLCFSAYFTPQEFNFKVSLIVNALLFLIGAPHWFRNSKIPAYWLNVLSQIANAGASVWICSFLGPTSHINLVAIPQFIMGLMMFSGIHPRTTFAAAALCLWLLSLPLFPFVNTWYLHKRMPEEELIILRWLLDITVFSFSTYQFKIISDAWSTLLAESERERTIAQRQNEWRRKLLHILSHDIKEPVVHSLLAVRSLGRSIADPDSMLVNQIETSQNSIREMITNVEFSNQILDSGQVQLSGLPKSELQLQEVILRIRPMYESRLREKGITLSMGEVSPEHRIIASADTFIFQTFMNLLSNAIKFSPERTSIRLDTAQNPDGSVSWFISDSGPGIRPEAFADTLIPETGTLGEHGSGLGIKIARSFADQNSIQIRWMSPRLQDGPCTARRSSPGTRIELRQAPPCPTPPLSC